MTELIISQISNGEKIIRTTGTAEDPLFLAKDVVEALGNKWNRKRSISHVPGQWIAEIIEPVRGGEFNSPPSESPFYLTELGLYFYLNRSDSPKALPWQIKVAKTLKAIRQGKQIATQDTKIRRLEDELSELTDRLLIVSEQLDVFKRAEGAITLQFAAIKLKQLGVWNQSEFRLVDWMETNGIVQRCPAKRRTFVVYKKYFDRGYFDWVTLQSGDPKPLIKSEILLTPRGLTWLTEMLSALKQKMDAPLIDHSVSASRRRLDAFPLPPEAGGAIEIEDELGRTHRYDAPVPVFAPDPAFDSQLDARFYDENLHRIHPRPRPR